MVEKVTPSISRWVNCLVYKKCQTTLIPRVNTMAGLLVYEKDKVGCFIFRFAET